MKTNREGPRTIAWFLTALLLFQSCVVYHRTPTTLKNASQIEIKTKITNSTGETFKYKYIIHQDGQYYGMSFKSREWIKTPLSQKEISQVLTENKTASTWANVGLGVVVGPIAIWMLFVLGFYMVEGS